MTSPNQSRSFLPSHDRRELTLPDARGLQPHGLILGAGPNALEVAVTEAARRPTAADLRAVWARRLAGRASPLLLVALYGDRAVVCGPVGDPPPVVFDLNPVAAERICAAALDEPNRHAALRFLQSILPEIDSPLVGLRNEGLLATHELEAGVPARPDWSSAQARARPVLTARGTGLLGGLGFSVESTPGPVSILRSAGTKTAIAILLDRSEAPELTNTRFSGLSPVAYAMAKADEERVPYVIVLAGPTMRLYTTRIGTGVGRRGRTETFVEVRLDLLREEQAGYLWLLFSAEALQNGGTFEQILNSSQIYAADLGKRLRDRVYDRVIPQLAEGLVAAQGLRAPTSDDLANTYQMAMTVLFRVLCIAYAEDKGLLPYRTNPLYQTRSLKQKALELRRVIEAGTAFDTQTTHWDELFRLFRAVDQGNAEWGVPPYNGGLYSSEPDVAPLGARLIRVTLPNEVFGPILGALLLDETPDGRRGPVDFRSLGVREFGTIYEGLLESGLSVAEADLTLEPNGEYRPVQKPSDAVKVRRGRVYLHNAAGVRKATGSYFTKHFAVEHLVEHVLEPALDDHLKRLDALGDREAGDAFFDFRVADIAMGSGHFLVAAVDRIERALSGYLARRSLPDVTAELERLRSKAHEALRGSGETAEIEDAQLLRRQIARRCVYGVDLNPLAVELAKLSLWIHTFVPGLPLSFLDHSLVVGNSLVGVGTIAEAQQLMTEIHRTGTGELFVLMAAANQVEKARVAVARLARLSDATAAEIEQARKALQEAREAVEPVAALFDVLTAGRTEPDVRNRASQEISHWAADPGAVLASDVFRNAQGALAPMPAFHFPIAFPEIFLRDEPGFDVIIGNPPWEKAKVEEDTFWVRFLPGLIRGMTQAEKEIARKRVMRERPDLVRLYELETKRANLLRRVLLSLSLPGMGAGDPDLYKAFVWRFWQLTRQDRGKIGVVLPRLMFSGRGGTEFRREILTRGKILDLTILENKGQWVFEDVHPQMSIALCAFMHNETDDDRTITLRGPFFSEREYRTAMAQEPGRLSVRDVMVWTDTAAIPVLPSAGSLEVLLQIRKAPRVDLNDPGSWKVRPHTELHATNDKHLMLVTDKPPSGYWPVFAGESFDIWRPDTGTYYAWANPAKVVKALQVKRLRSSRLTGSAFSELSPGVLNDPRTLPCHSPRIAFRDITKASNRRTLIAALIPPTVFVQHTAPYLMWIRGGETDQAYLLGILCAIPFDWYVRRFAELHLSYNVFSPLPVPRPPLHDSLRHRVAAIAGRLACQDRRFTKWAAGVGAVCGPLAADEKEDLIRELDAVVAHLYGLTELHLRHIFETFHEGWEYGERLEATTVHYRAWRARL